MIVSIRKLTSLFIAMLWQSAVLRLVASAVGGCVLVPDMAAGIAVWRTSAQGTNAVTLAGDRVTASGGLVSGAGSSSLGLVERAGEVRRRKREQRRPAANGDREPARHRI